MSEVEGYTKTQGGIDDVQSGGLIDFHYLGVVFLIALALSSLFEIGLLVYAYVNAEKVECDLLWCIFTSGDTITIKDSYSNYTSSISSTSNCFVNGEQVNCSEIEDISKRYKRFMP